MRAQDHPAILHTGGMVLKITIARYLRGPVSIPRRNPLPMAPTPAMRPSVAFSGAL